MALIDSARAELLRILEKADVITVISHYNPDSDAYGSSLGLAASLQRAGKTVTTVNQSGITDKYTALPFIQTIVQSPPSQIPLLIVCDCGSFNRVGDTLLPLVSQASIIVNIDHHISNDNFGTLNIVDTTASSTSEIVYDLLRGCSLPIDTDIASCLLAGIIGDTGSFRYASTQAKTFRVAADLVEHGASPTHLFKSLYGSPSLSTVKLQAECMLNLSLDFENQYAEIVVTEAQRITHGASLEDAEGLAERARDISGVKIAAALREDGPLWRVSLRSVDDAFNVSEIAESFGGGGHRQAAAFRSRQPFETIRTQLRQKIREVLL